MRPLAQTVRKALRELGIERDVDVTEALRAWPSVAARQLGADASSTYAVRVEERTLVVAVPTAEWGAEIRLRQGELVAALGRAAPRSGVTHIRSVPHDRRSVPGPVQP
ncbi:MAG: DciA family protein [Candidatus Limnocylindria bacterium]